MSSGRLGGVSEARKLSRRSFLSGTALAAAAMSARIEAAGAAAPAPLAPLPPPLGKDVFRARQRGLREAMKREGLDALFVTPSTNLQYCANLTIGRSERLTALILPATGPAALVTPFFEVPRSEGSGVFEEMHSWQESEDPIALCARLMGTSHRIGIEGSTAFETAEALGRAAKAELRDGSPLFSALRRVKTPQEQDLIRAAAARTLAAIEGTWKRLRPGMTELDGERILEEEFTRLGTPSGGLVQFGPSSALPHGGPGERRLRRGDVVLIDTGCNVHGYNSDVTRMASLGKPSDRVRRVYETVDRAQRAGISALKAGASGQQVDAAARKVIDGAGFGKFFTHRLGHGLGMDGHEAPYLVSGNAVALVPGNVETVEPGIYLPGEFGVRIEDDYAVTESTARGLSERPQEMKILET
ncbi:MAG: M24 family metallopeptidase [Thermoanaerobaculia bacterium]